MNTIISRRLVPEAERMDTVDRLFGINYVLKLEPAVFQFAEHLAENYDYGYWEFFLLSSHGFYMAQRSDTVYNVSSDNGFAGEMTADALGITACLYAFSHLSFSDGGFAGTCAEHYHLLREFVHGHAEARSIFRATD